MKSYRDGVGDGKAAVIIAALDAANGNMTKAAKALKVNRSTLWRQIKKLKIRRSFFKP